jgi:hypothetical protein
VSGYCENLKDYKDKYNRIGFAGCTIEITIDGVVRSIMTQDGKDNNFEIVKSDSGASPSKDTDGNEFNSPLYQASASNPYLHLAAHTDCTTELISGAWKYLTLSNKFANSFASIEYAEGTKPSPLWFEQSSYNIH